MKELCGTAEAGWGKFWERVNAALKRGTTLNKLKEIERNA